MPGGDGTGPMGRGPMTGWGRGNCTIEWLVEDSRGVRRAMRRGNSYGGRFWSCGSYGRRRGFRNFWQFTASEMNPDISEKKAKEWEKEDLEEEKKY